MTGPNAAASGNRAAAIMLDSESHRRALPDPVRPGLENMKLRLVIAGLFLVASTLLAAQTNTPARFPATLTADFLISHSFYAVSDLWQMSPPERDGVTFQKDGRVENKRAGLAGRWKLADDKTVEITSSLPNSHPVRLSLESDRTSLFAPFRKGTQTGTRIYLAPEKRSAGPLAVKVSR